MALLTLLVATPALAFDPFEIQVYDGTADAAGRAGLEMHINRHHDETHVTFEPSYGITSFWEIGGYFQTAQGHYQGVKLRTKLVMPTDDFRFGVNFEISLEPGATWGGEIRPIFAWETDRFLVAANPNLSYPGTFEPGAMAKVKVGPVAVGLEYYGTFPGNENYLFEAVDLVAFKQLELNFGIGEGETFVAKMILGYAF
ncbi:MAG: hypothetical protein ABR567_14270 [Myxococcales bacterium]|nr:hypothetical protein [Myxococcales bacterium]